MPDQQEQGTGLGGRKRVPTLGNAVWFFCLFFFCVCVFFILERNFKPDAFVSVRKSELWQTHQSHGRPFLIVCDVNVIGGQRCANFRGREDAYFQKKKKKIAAYCLSGHTKGRVKKDPLMSFFFFPIKENE